MKCLILAAGYATRLYPLTENFPKPLLKVKDKTIIDYLIDDLDNHHLIDEYFIVTNHKFYKHFIDWNTHDNLSVIDDLTDSNENRLGAVKDIELVLANKVIDDDLLIMAGDNLLNFSLNDYVNYFKGKKTSTVVRYFSDDLKKLQKTGVATIDENEVITLMEEKPKEPKGNWMIPPFYIIRKQDLHFVKQAIEDGVNVDAPGSFIAYLASKTTVHAYKMPGVRFDIGNLESYQKAQEEYQGITC